MSQSPDGEASRATERVKRLGATRYRWESRNPLTGKHLVQLAVLMGKVGLGREESQSPDGEASRATNDLIEEGYVVVLMGRNPLTGKHLVQLLGGVPPAPRGPPPVAIP